MGRAEALDAHWPAFSETVSLVSLFTVLTLELSLSARADLSSDDCTVEGMHGLVSDVSCTARKAGRGAGAKLLWMFSAPSCKQVLKLEIQRCATTRLQLT